MARRYDKKVLKNLKTIIGDHITGGFSYEEIARMLNDSGYRRPSGGEFKKTDVGAFCHIYNMGKYSSKWKRKAKTQSTQTPIITKDYSSKKPTMSTKTQEIEFVIKSTLSPANKVKVLELLLEC